MFKWKKGVCTENLTYPHQVKKKYENNLDMEKYSNGVLSLKNLTKRFGTNVVLDNISLTIEDGKTTVIIGPSGCGKTVLEKHLMIFSNFIRQIFPETSKRE